MRRILQMFVRNGGFFTFALLEVFCMYLTVNFDDGHGQIYARTSLLIGGNLNQQSYKFERFLSLPVRLEAVTRENDSLRTALLRARTVRLAYRDTFYYANLDTLQHKIYRPGFEFISAEVISNSIGGSSNWLMLNRGLRDGVTDNSGVVTRQGLVGIVRFTDDNFALVMSLLHRQTKVSARLESRGYFGSLIWEGNDPGTMLLNDIPKHVTVATGDTVVTSGYSLMFPQGHPVGFVDSVSGTDGSNFHTIRVRLGQPMADVHDVYVVKNIFQTQIDSLLRLAKDE